MRGRTGPEQSRICPYCDEAMTWIPFRWFGRGTFACDRCGEFPDFRPKDDEPHGAVVPSSDEQIAIAQPADARPCVLMIDDSTAERDLYALMLERDLKVLTAARGSEGLAMAEKERPDVIVLDVMMPGMSGWEVCRRLKSNPRTAPIPVIMLTAQDEPNLLTRAREQGATTLLTKPCSIGRLTSTLYTVILASHHVDNARP